MNNTALLNDWTNEIYSTLPDNDSLFIALFTTEGELLFASPQMTKCLPTIPTESFINPSFKQICTITENSPLIFEGFLTLTTNTAINASIRAKIYRKNNQLLIIGAPDASQLFEQNSAMHQLNREIGNLQRNLLKEKKNLENTLNLLNAANAELKTLNAGKDRFISILAHDLRNPFAAILGILGMLSKNLYKYDYPKIESFINSINDTAHFTYNMLEDILIWVKAQSNHIQFDPQNYLLKTLCEKTITNTQPVANTKNIKLSYTEAGQLNVFADFNMLTTIIRNLLSNAIKFTEPNGKVTINASENETGITVSVTDTGIGMSAEVVAKLFNIAEKVSSYGTAHEQGCGLGLIICKEFVGKHNGQIWIESQPNQGTTVFFTLPKQEMYK